jgi:hypothetical protein
MTERRSGWFLVLYLSVVSIVHAQTPEATISGIITDPTGAVVPGVQVTATNSATGQHTAAVTNEQGFYVLASLPIGVYTIEAALTGFKKYVRYDLTLTTSATIPLDIQLAVGDVSQTMTVSGEAPLLEARTSDVSQLIESRTVADMPLGDRRTLNLINLSGAAVFVNYDSGQKPNFSLAGGRTQSQMFWIDGGTGQNMRLGIGQVDLDPPVEVVQEVKILTNNYSAEYGGSAGGVIIATTKSGTNNFHGSAFEYFRNDVLDAANFFAPIVDGKKSKAPLRYNVFGGTLGGPIRTDKTFFFFGYEGSRRHEGLVRTLTVPTALQRQGDFSQTFDARGNLIVIYDPATTRMEGGRIVRTPFLGNRIPAERLDPVAVKLLPFWPVANKAPDTLGGANNFRANYTQILTRNNFTVKVDHQLSNRDKIQARYLYNSDDRDFTSVFPDRAANPDTAALRHQNYFYAGHTRTFGTSLINELRYTYSDRINHEISFGLGTGWPSRLGLRGVVDNAFPQFTVAGFATLGAGTHERRQFPIRQHQLVDTVSYLRGRHALKAGGEIRPSRNYEVNRISISGQYSFTTLPTGQPGAAATGNGLASLLLGFPNSVTVRETDVLDRSSWYLAAFIQDDWTVRSDLTLNLGLRWETDTPIRDKNNRMNGFDPAAINPVSGTPGVVRFAGVDGWPASPYQTDWNNFGPRLGFAWRPPKLRNTVVRGGFGIFFAHPFDHGAPSSASLGFENSASLSTPDNGITAPFFLRDGVPMLTVVARDAGFGAVPVSAPTTTAVTFYERNRRTGYAQQFNLGIQRELRGAILVEATYLGNLSRKLPSPNLSINQTRPERVGSTAAQRDRPFPQFSNVSILFPTLGVSNYHAAVLRVEKRFSHGINFLSTYTWSKFLNNTDEGGGALGDPGVYSNFYNRRADYGPSANDIRHRFTWSSVYELPLGREKRFLSGHWLGRVIGEWSIGAVAALQSGPPFTVTTQTNTTNAFSAGALRADARHNPELKPDERAVNRWFDTSAFGQPPASTFGNSGRGILRGPGRINFDFSMLKNLALTEKKLFQLRLEMFNAFNHTNFGLPGHVFGGPAFGVVSSAAPGRTLQLGLRFAF